MLLKLLFSGSGSSGRISTISGCSMGDSGTHSDHEERKVSSSKCLFNYDFTNKTFQNMGSPVDDDFRQDLNRMLYMIPPTPKPVKLQNTIKQCPTIEVSNLLI